MALSHLFGFGHAQSDNIKAGKPAPIFQKNIIELLKSYNVVIADRNNHLRRHRTGIREAVSSIQPPPRLIALHWAVPSHEPATVHGIVTERIVSRGDNHQTLTPNNTLEYEEIVRRFLKESEELAEDEVDDIIEIEVEEGLEESLERAVTGIVDLLGMEKPSIEQMGEALRVAREYQPPHLAMVKKKQGKERKNEKKGAKTPRYYGLLPEMDLSEVMGSILNSITPVPDSARAFWEKLKDALRYTSRPHVTIVHMKERENDSKLWDACEKLTQDKSPLFEISLSHLVWNDDVMAFAVDNLTLAGETDGEEAGHAFLKSLDDDARKRFHITIGTRDPSIPPVQAKDMIQKWRAGKETAVLALDGLSATGRITGLVQ